MEQNDKKFKKSKKKEKRESSTKYDDIDKKWYQLYSVYNTSGEVVELKTNELTELTNLCKSAFDAEAPNQIKNNPSDAKWLETALHKGTSRDRANAGALLVQSNPIPNTAALDTLIALTKLSNKGSPEVIEILTDLFVNALLPADRKLISLGLRGSDWKSLQANDDVDKATKSKIYAYWHFENTLKENYFGYLQNVQTSLQTGQENNKCKGIITASRLLIYSPEKEQMLLSMLINKLGDPLSKVAGKALYHLSEVAFQHPNMCSIIVSEVEKILFRNNISEKAQHFALSFMSQLAGRADSAACTRLVGICFSFFKVLVEKGEVNSKTMQAILTCLRRAIGEVKSENSELLTKEVEGTIYRMIHIADISISLQALCLLLQIMLVKTGNYDRFYNALYKKLLDPDIASVGLKTSSLFFYIIHRAIHLDKNVPRAQAMIKRLLQVALYYPAPKICAVLIIISKILKSRPELKKEPEVIQQKVPVIAAKESDDESDEEERYEDILDEKDKPKEKVDKTSSSWFHVKNKKTVDVKDESGTVEEVKKVKEMETTKYDPLHRNPTFAGAQFALRTELLMFMEHFHPTVQVFAKNIMEHKSIEYFGDPIRDFSITQFLERFSFRNPKKEESKEDERSVIQKIHLSHKAYSAHGSRGQPVQALTSTNCTEDERFIFAYLDHKRAKQVLQKDDDEESTHSVDDDEFEAYLDGLGGKAEMDDDLDYLADLENEEKKGKKKKSKKTEGADDEGDDDWDEGGDDEDADIDEEFESEGEEVGSDADDFEMDMSDDDDDNESVMTFSGDESDKDGEDGDDSDNEEGEDDDDDDEDDEDDDEPKAKKSKKVNQMSSKDFARKLKGNCDMNSLFAAAEDFSELLEETGKTKNQGTLGEVFNQDKASDKQLKWEEKRRDSGRKSGGGRSNFSKKGKSFGGKKKKR